MSENDLEMCENCIFWQKWKGYHKKGTCRRYPPSLFAEVDGGPDGVTTKAYAAQPETEADDWCGEFKERNGL